MLLTAVLSPIDAYAAREITINDGGTAQVTVSQKELTRIGISGSKLSKVMAVDGQFTVQADDDSGEAYIRPAEGTPVGKSFSFFVKDHAGGTYTILASVADVPAQTVLLKTGSVVKNSPKIGLSLGGSEPFVSAIKRLIRGILTNPNNEVDGCTKETVNTILPIWAETSIQIVNRWNCSSLTGEELQLRNTSKTVMRLDEHEFESLYPDIRAVSITTHVLNPQQSTQILLVRKGVVQ